MAVLEKNLVPKCKVLLLSLIVKPGEKKDHLT